MTSLQSLFVGPVSFEKWHGAQNDFLFCEAEHFLSALRASPEHDTLASAASLLCHRHCGIGADGVVLWHRHTSGKVSAGIWNSDGTRAGTCGNALRCLAALLTDKNLWDGKQPLDVLDLSVGPQSVDKPASKPFAKLIACSADNKKSSLFAARVDMGEIKLVRGIDLNQFFGSFQIVNLSISERLRSHLSSATFVSLANPHLVLTLKPSTFDTFTREDFVTAGQLLQSEGMCAALGIPVSNIGFVELPPETAATGQNRTLNGIVYERGAGLTPCCGSGGCAMKVALECEKHSTPEEAESIAMPGGVIQVRTVGKTLELKGPAERFCNIRAE
jgi:diaminopimelate epimerase